MGTAIVVIVGFFLFVGLIFWGLLRKDAKRTAQLNKIAQSKGLTFKEFEEPDVIKQKFASLPIFNLGTNALLENLMTGSVNDYEVWIGDYIYWNRDEYADGSTRISHKKGQTVICVLLQKEDLPAFDITVRMSMSNLSAYDSDRVLDLGENSDFTQKYIVSSAPTSDKSVVEKLITSELKTAFENHKGLKVEVNQNQIMLTSYKNNIKTQELVDHIVRALAIGKALI